MIDCIFIARTGLEGFQYGLRAIANNTTNMNTPGFKGSSVHFADMFYGNTALGNGYSYTGQFGYGLNTLGTAINFRQGQLQSTGNSLDLAVKGLGFFVLRDEAGNVHYSQDGQFKFNSDGVLISATNGETVLGMGEGGALTPITLKDLQTNPAKATGTITFTGNLSSTATTNTLTNVTVIDNAGTTHSLTMTFTADSTVPGNWTVTLKDGSTTVGTSTLTFAGGRPSPSTSTLTMTYTPTNGTAVPLTLDFSANVTSYDSGSVSNLAVAKQDGYGFGQLKDATFDANGSLTLIYTNGQTVTDKKLALAQFRSDDDVIELGNNLFQAKAGKPWEVGTANSGRLGGIASGQVEMSNVDLSTEFSNLVIMQRGYQACAQVVSTSSEMLTTLYNMNK